MFGRNYRKKIQKCLATAGAELVNMEEKLAATTDISDAGERYFAISSIEKEIALFQKKTGEPASLEDAAFATAATGTVSTLITFVICVTTGGIGIPLALAPLLLGLGGGIGIGVAGDKREKVFKQEMSEETLTLISSRVEEILLKTASAKQVIIEKEMPKLRASLKFEELFKNDAELRNAFARASLQNKPEQSCGIKKLPPPQP